MEFNYICRSSWLILGNNAYHPFDLARTSSQVANLPFPKPNTHLRTSQGS